MRELSSTPELSTWSADESLGANGITEHPLMHAVKPQSTVYMRRQSAKAAS